MHRAGVTSEKKAIAAASFLVVGLTSAAFAEDAKSSLLKQGSLTDTPEGPKAQLRKIGIMPDVWITQIYQGEIAGDASKTWRYGGKLDAFLKVDAHKLGLWQGLHLNAQYEHYFGRTINNTDFTLLPVSAAQAFVQRDGYHSALSIAVTQDFGESFSIGAGKVNTMTLASQTPLIGGGGVETFMNRAFAAPATGIGVTSPGTLADRVVVSPTYTLGATATLKTRVGKFTLAVADPRNAQNSRVIENPFERGVVVSGTATIPIDVSGLRGYHTVRGAYSNARGFDLDDIQGLRRRLLGGASVTKKGYWFISYALQQYLFQSGDDPSKGWGLFSLITLTDGNPNPVKWTVLGGLAGNNLLPGRELDRWGVGYFHYGLSEPLLIGLAASGVYRRSERGVEAFYNYAVTPWLRLTADLQIIDPWYATTSRATFAALRMQTKF